MGRSEVESTSNSEEVVVLAQAGVEGGLGRVAVEPLDEAEVYGRMY